MYLLLSKLPSWSHGFNAKIGLKNGPPGAEIFAKKFLNMARQTKPHPHFVFLKYLVPVVRFSNRFLHWNCGIEMVVLSTIKSTNGVFENWKILPKSIKSCLKNPKLREKLELIRKKGFSFRYLWPLIEHNQLKYPMHQNLCYLPLSWSSQNYWIWS